MPRFSYVPFQDLIDASRALVAGKPTAMQDLQAALSRVDSAFEDQANCSDDICRARELATDELEIDDEPMVSVGDRGVWVNAWVWVPAPAGELSAD